MRTRWIAIIGGLLLVAAVVFTGIGVAQAMGGNGPWGVRQNTENGWGPMMGGHGPNGTYGPGGMMGGYGPGGMMGGYNGAQQDPSSATPVTGNAVTIQNFAFAPANLQVKVGTTVTWTNNDTAPHTVTFRDGSLTSSSTLRQGDTYSYTFTKTGTFSYYCDFHPYMVGQVVVTQ